MLAEKHREGQLAICELVITDVTRYGTLFCVAGWDLNNGGMIRPEPPTANAIAEASRFWSEMDAGPARFFSVGNRVRIDASAPPINFPFPHATEDRLVVAGAARTILGQMTLPEVAHLVSGGLSEAIKTTFGGNLQRAYSGKAHVIAGVQTCSLDAVEIEPGMITFYEDSPTPAKRRLRAVIQDDGVKYDFSVPADAARNTFLAGGVQALDANAAASDRVHVRLGLCRPFAAMPNSCYAQINGLYFL